MFGVLVVSMSLMCTHIASLVLLLIYVTEAILHYNLLNRTWNQWNVKLDIHQMQTELVVNVSLVI